MNMQGIGRITVEKVKENVFTTMEICMSVSGKPGEDMAWETISSEKAITTQVSGKTI